MSAMNDKSEYEDNIHAQVSQYVNVQNMHAQLSDINSYWKKLFVTPAIREVFGTTGVDGFYAQPFINSIKITGSNRLLSIGSGDGAVEIAVAKKLRQAGVDFKFTLLELSKYQIDRAVSNVSDANLSPHFDFIECDLNKWQPESEYAGIMAHHSLHHILNLEGVFDGIKKSLLGKFCSMDIIGMNGHMRYPETFDIIKLLWNVIPDAKKSHKVLKGYERGFYNYDCSKKGFEGVRAQDILPLLIERFGFEKFYAYGGIVDVFTGRGFGHHYSPSNNWDKSFIDLVANLNEMLIDCGRIKPTIMLAIMVPDKGASCKFRNNRTPQWCVRDTVL